MKFKGDIHYYVLRSRQAISPFLSDRVTFDDVQALVHDKYNTNI